MAVVWNAAKIMLVYCGAGPLIGLAVFAIGFGAMVVAGGQPSGLWIVPFILIYGSVFAHLVGLPWAFVAGGVAIGLSHFVSARGWVGPASGVASFAIAALSGYVSPPGMEPATGAAPDRLDAALFVLMAGVHVVSAMVCWLMARGLIRH
jgi:hypothetical protein